ncbi:MAG: hypothetical protein RLZZ435_2058 [Cyanobacteriota bacterium]|jgi:hypothetical protein
MFPVRSLLISSSCLALVVGMVQANWPDRSLWRPSWSQGVSGALIRNTIAAPLSLNPSLGSSCAETATGGIIPIGFPPGEKAVTLKAQGTLACVNDRPVSLPWIQIQTTEGKSELAIADFALGEHLSLGFLDSDTPELQPVDWFAVAASPRDGTLPLALATTLSSQQRYLHLSPLVEQGGWQVRLEAGVLHLDIPPAQVQALRFAQQNQGFRAVLELDRPALFTTTQDSSAQGDRWTLMVEGTLAEPFVQPQFLAFLQQDPIAQRLQWQMQTPLPRLTASPTPPQTYVSATLPPGLVPTVSRLNNPHRLVIDFQPRAFRAQRIAWAKGMTWQQDWVQVRNKAVAVVWLTLEPSQWNPGFQLRPLLPRTHRQSIAQLQSLPRLGTDTGAIVAINAGYFNRNNQLPLGALRTAGDWISGPILNRGVVAWQPSGEGQFLGVQFDRFRWEETVTIEGKTIPLTHLNSGYVKAGIARYTPFWGQSYSPLIDGETLLTVINDRLTQVHRSGKAQTETIAIPEQGYLLAARASDSIARQLTVGSPVQLGQTAAPSALANYPEMVGAGPLLVKNGRVVLDAAGEGFSTAFSQQAALRSAIGQSESGQLLVVAIGSTPGGALPTLAEMAEIMLKLGAIDALNLDGGSSSSLYLGGKVLNRSPSTAARIHNGLGVVYQPD